MFDLLLCVNMNSEHINKAFNGVCQWFEDINMESELDYLPDELEEILKKDNPFIASKSKYLGRNYIDLSPTDKVIRLLYELADETICKKYPDAIVHYKVDGYNSSFKVDDDTLKCASHERRLYDD